MRVYLPNALSVDLVARGAGFAVEASPGEPGVFEAEWPDGVPYRLRARWPGATQDVGDAYAHPPTLSDFDIQLLAEGRHFDLATRLGANPATMDGEAGVAFAVWAPNASSVSVVGDFNAWDPRRHPMRLRHGAGVWELFAPGARVGDAYKFALRGRDGQPLPWKADPLARRAELPPRTASVVAASPNFAWTDGEWMERRGRVAPAAAPISIYEVHVGAWLSGGVDGANANWDAAIDRLIPYVRHMGFTHVELMPITEHPFGGSWGYQPLSLFAPTARLGSPEDFARFVERCHLAGIGVIMDWVPAHFPSDEHGLARFDGTPLYEHADPKEGFHPDWNTFIYNFGRNETRGFLLASALWWINTFHIDGLRVDAVASSLYRDYSRASGEWVPNIHGGRENLESIAFFRELNTLVRPTGAICVAEESTAWPGVTAPVEWGGLGFDFKWNLGWMHDTLRYFERDPVHRAFHAGDLAFGLQYGFSEKYVLSISHDEVVHGKRSIVRKMPGDDWQRFANLRLLYAWMWAHPGKKLLFMGCEFGQEDEFNVDRAFPWPDWGDGFRMGLSKLVRDLNSLYRGEPALHRLDAEREGFEWVVETDFENSVFAFRRRARADEPGLLIVANMTPMPRHNYIVGVERPGLWREALNTDAAEYGGSGVGNFGAVATRYDAAHGRAQSLALTLPPLGLLVFAPPAE